MGVYVACRGLGGGSSSCVAGRVEVALRATISGGGAGRLSGGDCAVRLTCCGMLCFVEHGLIKFEWAALL